MTKTRTRSGSCLCGTVRLTAYEPENRVGACNCSMCRIWGGGPLLAVDCGTEVQIANEDRVTVFGSSEWAERGFCSICGTHLFYRLKRTGQVFAPAGLFTDQDGFNFDHQVFIDEKPDYYEFANQTHDMTGAEVIAKYGGG